MGNKIKPRRVAAQEENGRKKVRNWVEQDANESGRYKAGPMRDRRERRPKDARNRAREFDFETDD